jgi:hypothetical protein
MLGRDDQVFVDISAIALNAAISGSILAVPEACLVMMMALPFGSTREFGSAQCSAVHRPGSIREKGQGLYPYFDSCILTDRLKRHQLYRDGAACSQRTVRRDNESSGIVRRKETEAT